MPDEARAVPLTYLTLTRSAQRHRGRALSIGGLVLAAAGFASPVASGLSPEKMTRRGLAGPTIAVITGLRKPWMTTFRDADDRAVRRVGQEQLATIPRRLPSSVPPSTLERERERERERGRHRGVARRAGGSKRCAVFAFLGPVFALLGLGPRRATAWCVRR